MPEVLPANFLRLIGTLGLGVLDEAAFSANCLAMREQGFEGVYFNDLFFRVVPRRSNPPAEQVLFAEDENCLVYRDEKDLAAIRGILAEAGLTVESSHFLQSLPPPGEEPSYIYPIHTRLLDIAAAMGLKRVTSHIGFMLGVANVDYMGDAARQFQSGELPLEELCELARERYGEQRFMDHSVEIYRHLCGEAAQRGITVTVETACAECLEANTSPEVLRAFIEEVGAPNLKVCLDAGHCHIRGVDVPAMVRGLGELLVETHFHDNFGEEDRHNPVGIGTLNWRDIILAMHDAGYSGSITFEQGDYRMNGPAWRRFVQEAERALNPKKGH